MTTMDLSIHTTRPCPIPTPSLPGLLPRRPRFRGPQGRRFRRDALDHCRRPGQPGTSILLAPPAADPGITDDERRTIAEMMAKGTFAWIMLATKDLEGTFERVQASGAEVVQEPIEQYWGSRLWPGVTARCNIDVVISSRGGRQVWLGADRTAR
jgi:hypothetical protein